MMISSNDQNNNTTSNTTTTSMKPLTVVGPRLIPPKGLSAIYSLEFWKQYDGDDDHNNGYTSNNNFVVGAGKSGIIALWNTNNNTTDVDDCLPKILLLIQYLHGRDIVVVGLLMLNSYQDHPSKQVVSTTTTLSSSTTNTPSRLLSAGNDGTVCLWDLTTVSVTNGIPKLLHQTSTKGQLHSSGIFCMDVVYPSSSTYNVNIVLYWFQGQIDCCFICGEVDEW